MIKLNEFYTIEDDVACWTLTYRKEGEINPNTEKPKITSNVSYHANLKQALVKFMDESLKGSSSLQEVLDRLREVEAKIEACNLPIATK